eukprot:5902815-Prorocentrum_lima.AAC.1
MVSNDLDPRDRWMGLKALRKGYTPVPYTLVINGRVNSLGNRAEAAASLLANNIWSLPPPPTTLDSAP